MYKTTITIQNMLFGGSDTVINTKLDFIPVKGLYLRVQETPSTLLITNVMVTQNSHVTLEIIANIPAILPFR